MVYLSLTGLTLILKRIGFFYKICNIKGGKSTFVSTDNINIRISTFQDHKKIGKHGQLRSKSGECKERLQRQINHVMKSCILCSKQPII